MISRSHLSRYMAADSLGLTDSDTLTETEAAEIETEAASWRKETATMARTMRTAAELESKLRECSDPDPDGDRFALAEALYYFAAEWHRGQFSPLYRISCRVSSSPISFSPGVCSHGPEPDSGGEGIYRFLCARARRSYARAESTAEDAIEILAALCWTDPESDGGDE